MPEGDLHSLNRQTFPRECRERTSNYSGRFTATLKWQVNDGPVETEKRSFGKLPIMVMSKKCNLVSYKPEDLVKCGEEPEEFGGYFVVNGNEKIIRLLIANRRNHPMAIIRPSFTKRGIEYSKFGVNIRCVRPDESSQTIGLHYLTDGNIKLRFYWRKQEFLIPVVMVLKALVNCSDREIFEHIVQHKYSDFNLLDHVEMLLRASNKTGMYTQAQCLDNLGEKFRVALDMPEDWNDTQIGTELLRRVCLVHLDSNRDKFNMLIFMIQKLLALVEGKCSPDNPDSPQHQEVLLGGHVLAAFIKEKVEDWLSVVKIQLAKDIRINREVPDFLDKGFIKRIFGKVSSDIGRKVSYFLATGNIVSNTGLDISQVCFDN